MSESETRVKGLKVLIVEDNRDEQIIDEAVLGKLGVLITFANDGTEAIEKLSSKEYDLILMDVYMPIHDGLNATRWIRESEDDYYKNIPIFALTSFDTIDHTEEIMEAGMNEHLVKPLKADEFIEKVSKYNFRA